MNASSFAHPVTKDWPVRGNKTHAKTLRLADRQRQERKGAIVGQVGISNTEASNADACEYAWGFGFHPEMGYQLRDMGIARTEGINGHAALEIHYNGLKDGRDYDECAQDALDYIQDLRVKELMAGDFADPQAIESLNYLYMILQKYFDLYRSDVDDYEFLGIESFYAQEQPEEVDFYLPSRLDMVVYHKRGEFKGETSPFDHKFTYDFWHKPKFVLNSQFPLYILALRNTRFEGKKPPVVKRVVVNEIRRRRLKEPTTKDLFRRTPWDYTSKRLEMVFANHMKKAVRLAHLKRLPWPEALEEMKASLGSMACQYCDFKDLCDITFEDKDPSNVIQATLKKNEYGYPALEDLQSERS